MDNERPEVVTDEALEYLDDLRESGVTNMFGAGVYLQDDMDMSKADARIVLKYWMGNFKG